ncbi:MAG: hypothetical protein IJV06_06420 [Bacteroidaceae bacterium]|nr:hypothetical protein [Bacteroidaceae bacterium]
MSTMSMFAQDDLVATLSHGSSLKTYMGADALATAYTAAVAGDVITLSPGEFNGVTIEKAITIRGAGMQQIESGGYVYTQITGDMPINVPTTSSSSSAVVTIEGVQVLGRVDIDGDNLAPVKLLKSRFQNTVMGKGVSLNAYSCIFDNGLDANNEENTIFNCLNCVIRGAYFRGISGSYNAIARVVATNCIVCLNCDVPNSNFTNCIIVSSDWPLNQTCSAQNCIGINSNRYGNVDVFANVDGSSNVMIEGAEIDAFTKVFKTLTTTYYSFKFNETFELTPTAAAAYLGDDGKQVGIYGGVTPFDPAPTNPQIKKLAVSSTAEGDKLKVKIDVK